MQFERFSLCQHYFHFTTLTKHYMALYLEMTWTEAVEVVKYKVCVQYIAK